MLGDPHWILPKYRNNLYDLLRFFDAYSFAGVNLDLEPDMLDGAEKKRPELLTEMLATLRGAREYTKKPISLTVHPRYLEGDLGEQAIPGLEAAGIREIALMIYSTREKNVAARFQAICEAAPALRFSLAQSVEKDLPPSQSYYGKGEAAFLRSMKGLAAQVDALNAIDLIVQSWAEWSEMPR